MNRTHHARGRGETGLLSTISLLVIAVASLWSCAGLGPSSPSAVVSAPPPASGPEEAAPPSVTAPSAAPSGPRVALDKNEAVAVAATALEAGDPSAAVAAFDRLSAADAADPQMMALKAGVLSSAGRIDEAVELLSAGLAKAPENPDLLYALSVAQGLSGDGAARKATLERTVQADPKRADALSDLGDIALGARVYKTALAYYDRALSADGEHRAAILGKARTLEFTGKASAADALLTDALAADPDWVDALAARGRLRHDEGNLPAALSDLDAALALSDGYWTRVERGSVLMAQGKTAAALADFRAATVLDPGHFLAWVYVAGLDDLLGDWSGAEDANLRIVKLNPDYYFAFEALGILRIRDGRWSAAKDAFIEAYRRSGGRPNYALLAALAWMRAEGPQGPKTFLGLALKSVPRESTEWYVMRLYYDQSGDTNVAVLIDKEHDPDTRARMLYYLAEFYAVRGNGDLATRYHQQVQAMGRRGIVEWRLNEWALSGASGGGN